MEIRSSFQNIYQQPAAMLVRAPGRVNLLGEHVDYNDGIVLPVAIDREMQLAAAPTGDSTVHLNAIDLNEETSFDLKNLDDRVDLDGSPLPGWAIYPAAVAWAAQRLGLAVNGIQAAYTSNIPIGSGLSSSAAVEVGFAKLWAEIHSWDLDALAIARLCLDAENLYVGVACGLMDQFASACGVKGHALALDTRNLEWNTAPLPEGASLIIADSGMRRSLTTSAYNDRRASCEEAVARLKEYLPNIQSLRDVTPTEFASLSIYLPNEARMRAEHVVKEIARVESAVTALHRDDKQAFGALMYAGHRSLKDLYEVSIPELDILVDLTREIPGCIGARLTGAGFGGCTVNLVESEYSQSFITRLKTGYKKETGKEAQVYSCQASQGATAAHLSSK
jgi:galactokinase